ncbi:histone-lysine N-methyltransferase SETMAR [Trichonephila clavipes]|uniref:Histone-lysine N-methyltransferase SETMAR n=1 Tax=Trichonephila clavipes TaxID=2585209 RepID=A0A8X7BFW8_TRICX|nr:histone-lysine N-methyltransferase SETMAR [Trichonephila clavipes]
MVAEMNALVFDNNRITMNEFHRLLGIRVGTTHTIMPQHLNFRTICAQSVPDQLTAKQRNTRIALSFCHLQRYQEEEYGFLSQIVTGDATWGQHFATQKSPSFSPQGHTTYRVAGTGNRHQCPAVSSLNTEPWMSHEGETPRHIAQWRYFPA